MKKNIMTYINNIKENLYLKFCRGTILVQIISYCPIVSCGNKFEQSRNFHFTTNNIITSFNL